MQNILTLLAYVLAINAITAFLFLLDKRRAENGAWRVPENTLLGLAILGGSLGAKWAQRTFRHKTRKQPFANLLNAILALQILLIVALFIPQTRALLLGTG